MLLAQEIVPTSTGTWATLAALMTLIFGHVGKWFTDWMKDRREREDRKEARDLERDKQLTLYRIASAAEDSEKEDVKRHTELVNLLRDNCKATCDNYKKR